MIAATRVERYARDHLYFCVAANCDSLHQPHNWNRFDSMQLVVSLFDIRYCVTTNFRPRQEERKESAGGGHRDSGKAGWCVCVRERESELISVCACCIDFRFVRYFAGCIPNLRRSPFVKIALSISTRDNRPLISSTGAFNRTQ